MSLVVKHKQHFALSFSAHVKGTQNFGGIRVGNGPTEEDAEIIQHDQLSTHSEEGEEVNTSPSSLPGQRTRQQSVLVLWLYLLISSLRRAK